VDVGGCLGRKMSCCRKLIGCARFVADEVVQKKYPARQACALYPDYANSGAQASLCGFQRGEKRGASQNSDTGDVPACWLLTHSRGDLGAFSIHLDVRQGDQTPGPSMCPLQQIILLVFLSLSAGDVFESTCSRRSHRVTCCHGVFEPVFTHNCAFLFEQSLFYKKIKSEETGRSLM
jgi:hypothetical protein